MESYAESYSIFCKPLRPMDKLSPHTALKNVHKGEDIYILGSGATMNYISAEFFKGKITIGTNLLWKYFDVSYAVFKHQQFIQEAIDDGEIVIASKHDCGDIDQPIIENKNIDYIFTHKRGRFGDLEKNFQENIDAIGKDEDIFVSYSTITSCIHLAAYMGAKNIIICGHDCGWLDDESHFKDYGERLKDFHKENFNEVHNSWFEKISGESQRLKEKLVEIYGCGVYSLNPFINLRLEGHVFYTKK